MSRLRELSGGEKDVLAAELVHQRDGGQPLGIELDRERLATVALMEEYGCQDVLLTVADLPLPDGTPSAARGARRAGAPTTPPAVPGGHG